MDLSSECLRGLRSWASANGNVRELWLFGSRAQGFSRHDSDVDLAIALMPQRGTNDDPALGQYFALADRSWQPELEKIVGRHVSLEAIRPNTFEDAMVRCFGIQLWNRDDSSFNPMPSLILKPAAASRSSGEWNDDDFDVLTDRAVVGRIFKANAAPVGSPWMWTLAFGHREDHTPTHGYEPTREAAMAAFAKSWRRE
jgi:predicted nucleotidyltransferase